MAFKNPMNRPLGWWEKRAPKAEREMKCERCGRRGSYDAILAGTFPHTARCVTGKWERGERCPDCCAGHESICTSTASVHEFGCNVCNQRWGTDDFVLDYRNLNEE